jgi:hypothetical protein
MTPITALTDPNQLPNQLQDQQTFDANTAYMIDMLPERARQENALAAEVNSLASTVELRASAVATAAATVATSAANAARDAATAASAPGTSATSTTSMAIGLGSKTFTLAQTGKLFGRSNTITISAPTGDNWMSGPITAFNSATGEMTVNVTNISGSGTFAAWTVSLSGAAGLTGVVNELRAANIASAATTNLTAATGNLVHITGTTTISAFTLASGAERSVIFDSALTLINSSGLSLPSDTNIVTAAGDRALVRGDSNGAVVTHYQRASGLPVAGGAISKEYLSPDQVIVAGGTLTLAHGFGSRPKLIQPYLRCVVEQAVNNVTHQVGDIVPVIVQWNASFGCRIKADASNISVRYASGANGPGIFDIYLNDNWRFFIEAFA